jgi:hypothetical protein
MDQLADAMRITSTRLKLRQSFADERGVALVVTVAVMLTLLVVAAYAIDAAIWYVHGRHLQTQADAAALAAVHDYTCTPGTADTTVDAQIKNTVHLYDGTGLSTPAVTPYNPQVPKSPIPATLFSPTQHNIFSQVDAASYQNQSTPNDMAPTGSAWSGSPCADKAINVKLTESNLPSFFPFVSPLYINREAQVSIQGVASGAGALPLAIPSAAPTVMHGTLIDEGNGNAPIGAGRVTLTSTDGLNWSGTVGSVTLNGGTGGLVGPIGLRVDVGAGSTCGTQLVCYDSGASSALAYTRLWSPTAIPGTGTTSIAGPEIGDTTLAQGSSSPCPLTGAPTSTFSNFVSNSTACNAKLSTTVYFETGTGAPSGTSTTCSAANASLSLAVSNGSNPTMTCNSAVTTTNSPCSTATPCIATTWTSGNVSLGADNPDGAVTFDESWVQNYGTVGKNTCAPGGGNKCKGDFGVVQRAFNGGYDKTTAGTSSSGPIDAANVTDSSGNEFMSHQLDATATLLSIHVKILDLGAFVNVPADTVATTGNPVILHTGTNKGDFAIGCGPNQGGAFFTQYLAVGCPDQFAPTTLSDPPACTTPQTPAICVNQNQGNGKKTPNGIDCRVNGVLTLNADGSFNSCNATTTCVSPNHWVSPNTVNGILTQTPPDPRLVNLMIVDSNAWVGVNGGSAQTPIRVFATFYITGWSRNPGGGQTGDPCTGATIPTNPGPLPYTADDDPVTYFPSDPTNVLLGHFVQVTLPGSVSNPNGQPCNVMLGDCTGVLTK